MKIHDEIVQPILTIFHDEMVQPILIIFYDKIVQSIWQILNEIVQSILKNSEWNSTTHFDKFRMK